MPSTCCSVPGCSNRGGHKFPSNRDKCKAWVIAIKRVADKSDKQWWPSQSSVVCTSHFTAEDYEENNSRGFKSSLKVLKKIAVPSLFNWTGEVSENSRKRTQRILRRQTTKLQSECSKLDKEHVDLDDMNVANMEEVIGCDSSPKEDHNQKGVQTDNPVMVDYSTQTQHVPMEVVRMRHSDFRNDQPGLQFYTGLENYDTFSSVFASLGPASYQLNYLYGYPSIDAQNQFFLTLVKLRTYKTNFELSRMFKISESEVYNIFLTWIRFMALQWREVDIWPSREVIRYHAPSDFKRQFPTTRVIFDGTECPVQKPREPSAQQVTFSTYKNRNTAKVLIGVTPGGQVSYMSKAFGGSTSDRQIVERSQLTTLVEPGDSIMSDKGFDVQDMFAPMDVTINIPTFFKKKNRMTGQTVLRDRAVSSKRVHVERVIGLGKTYKILSHPLNQSECNVSCKSAINVMMIWDGIIGYYEPQVTA